jgi:hypothetical protein
MAVIRPKAGVNRCRLRILRSRGVVAAIQAPVSMPYRQVNSRNVGNALHLYKHDLYIRI